jgi:hypothetical protein
VSANSAKDAWNVKKTDKEIRLRLRVILVNWLAGICGNQNLPQVRKALGRQADCYRPMSMRYLLARRVTT